VASLDLTTFAADGSTNSSAPVRMVVGSSLEPGRGAVLALSFFFGAFACFIPGLLIANGLVRFLPTTAVDLSLGFSLLAVQAFLSCVVATMSPEELAAMSRQPYNTH